MSKGIQINIGFSSKISEICEPLKQFGITSFNFLRTYNDGSQISLCNRGKWLAHFYNMKYYTQGAFEHHPKNYQSGYTLWNFLSGQNIFQDARQYFNIDNGITIIEKTANYCEFYFFASTQENHNIINFYINNIDILKRFNMYFKSAAVKIIKEASDNRIIIPNHFKLVTSEIHNEYTVSNHDEISNFIRATKVKEYHLNGELNGVVLTNREMDCAIRLLEGKSSPEISRLLFISPRTVESHINHIKEKLICHTKSELIGKLLNSGLEIHRNKNFMLLAAS